MKHIYLSVVLLLTGCGVDRTGEPPFGVVESSDPEMVAAIERARSTFDFFTENYKTMENDGYSVKFGLKTPDDDLEYIWFNPIEISGNEIKAACANEPVNLPGLKPGDVRTLKRSEVADWMIVVGKKCYGGFTIQFITAKIPRFHHYLNSSISSDRR